MIRIDFTSDSDGKYAGSVYYIGEPVSEETLNLALHRYAREWRLEGNNESFADYLVRHRTDFMPKTSVVFHFAI